MLSRHGADFNQQDENGFTATHHAIAKNNVEAITYMIDSNMVNFEVISFVDNNRDFIDS